MLWLVTALLNTIGAILKVAWMPSVVTMLVSIPARPVINMLQMPEEPKQRLLRFFLYATWISTTLVLLAFVLLFGSLWLAGKQAAAHRY